MEKDKRMTEKERKHESFCFEGHANVNKGCVCPCHVGEKVSAEQRAEKIWHFIDKWQNTDSYTDCWRDEIVPHLIDQFEQAEREARRDAVIEFCEGDRSKLAEYEQEAYAKGYKAGAEATAKIVEGDVLQTPNEFEGKTKLKVFDLLERIAAEIRALPLPEGKG